MPTRRPATSRTCRRHRRAFGSAEIRRGTRMARRRRPPTRPRPGWAGLRVVWPAPGRHRLGRDYRRASEPGSPPQGSTFPAGLTQPLTITRNHADWLNSQRLSCSLHTGRVPLTRSRWTQAKRRILLVVPPAARQPRPASQRLPLSPEPPVVSIVSTIPLRQFILFAPAILIDKLSVRMPRYDAASRQRRAIQ